MEYKIVAIWEWAGPMITVDWLIPSFLTLTKTNQYKLIELGDIYMGRQEDGFYHLTPKSYTLKLRMSAYKKEHANHILFRHGHIAIPNYKMGDNREFEKVLSVWDEIRFKYQLIGGYYVETLQEFRINRGFNVELLRNLFPDRKLIVDNDAYPYQESDVKLLVQPKDDFQRVALTFMSGQGKYVTNANYTQQIIEAKPGAGKALSDDTLVPTEHGWKRIDQISVGDYIFDECGNKIRVLGVYPQGGLRPTYRISFGCSNEVMRTVNCSIDHLWELYEDGRLVVVSVSEILRTGIHHFKLKCPETGEIRYTSGGKEITDISIESYVMLDIISIKPIEPTTQRCLLVDSPRHLFLVNNMVPTHNTYLSIAESAFLSARAIIFLPFEKLIVQWVESILKFTDATEKDIMVVQGSKACEKIREGKCSDIKYFIFMIDTIDSYNKRYGDMNTIEMLRNTNAFVKVIDEVHRDIKAIAMIEALSNFRMNFYMSASPGRSARKENWIFRTLFYSVPRFGSNFQLDQEKHINIVIKKYQFIPTQPQLKKMINARKKWLNTKAYETELISDSSSNKDFKQAIQSMLLWAKKQKKKDTKILILTSTIEGTAFMQNIAEEIFPGETSRYYGSMPSKEEKKKALDQMVICATDTSLGTGSDIPRLQFVFCAVTYTSWTQVIQMSGRLRKLPDAECVYCEFVNTSFYKTNRQYEKRIPLLTKQSKTGKLLVIN